MSNSADPLTAEQIEQAQQRAMAAMQNRDDVPMVDRNDGNNVQDEAIEVMVYTATVNEAKEKGWKLGIREEGEGNDKFVETRTLTPVCQVAQIDK